jgi:hypothetical protein
MILAHVPFLLHKRKFQKKTHHISVANTQNHRYCARLQKSTIFVQIRSNVHWLSNWIRLTRFLISRPHCQYWRGTIGLHITVKFTKRSLSCPAPLYHIYLFIFFFPSSSPNPCAAAAGHHRCRAPCSARRCRHRSPCSAPPPVGLPGPRPRRRRSPCSTGRL